MDLSTFATLSEAPKKATATAILVRFADGIAHRYYWSTEGLRQSELAFRPGPESMSIIDLLRHVHNLAVRCKRVVSGEPAAAPVAPIEDLEGLRRGTLENLAALRARLGEMKDEELDRVTVNQLPFWFLINGPLADMISHVGQVNGWRRLAGNPTPKAGYLRGEPPKKA